METNDKTIITTITPLLFSLTRSDTNKLMILAHLQENLFRGKPRFGAPELASLLSLNTCLIGPLHLEEYRIGPAMLRPSTLAIIARVLFIFANLRKKGSDLYHRHTVLVSPRQA